MKQVKMYTTAVCPYCVMAKQLLASKGVTDIEEIRIDINDEQRERMMEITGRRTVRRFLSAKHMLAVLMICRR